MTAKSPMAGALREQVKEAIQSQKRPTWTVLSSLLAIQDAIGYIPDEAIEEVANHHDTTTNEVWGVASFYTNFRFTPPTTHTVEVCWGPTCHLVGATKIIETLHDELKLEGEGDTDDGLITLRYNTCLGACAQGPVMSVNHRLVGRVTEAQARDKVSSLSKTKAKKH
ncbi:MAG: NAD(P)H-dependent oxidoreductase subunit E [Chloroflexi bacterium]|nr:NAD(P)H-dependent oxidoreductase subunit E [Chloroflexota bacterium]